MPSARPRVVTLPDVSEHERTTDDVSEPAAATGGAGDPDQVTDGAELAADGVIELLGLLTYASLVAFFRLADDASLAVSLPDKANLADMAVAQFGHFELLRARIIELGADPQQAMRPFVEPIDAFHARTAPS